MSLAERLATLRETSNTSLTSELVDVHSPLSLFLSIYSKATRECCLDNNAGSIALYKWLGAVDLPTDKYPEILNPNFSVPSLLYGYEQQELAKILSPSVEKEDILKVLKMRQIISNAIYFVMSKEIINETY